MFWLPLTKAVGITAPISCPDSLGVFAKLTTTAYDWDKPQLVCQPPCNDLPLPTYASSCAQTYFIDSFNIDGALSRMVSLSPWQQLLGIPSSAPPQGSKWFQIDGQIQASSEVSCVADMHLAIANAKINAYTGDFSLGARISTGTIAGLFFVAQDNFNLMRMQFNTLLRTISIIRLVNGNPIVIDYQYSPLITADVFHSVRVDVVSTMINVTFDGQLVLSSADGTFIVGAAGFAWQWRGMRAKMAGFDRGAKHASIDEDEPLTQIQASLDRGD